MLLKSPAQSHIQQITQHPKSGYFLLVISLFFLGNFRAAQLFTNNSQSQSQKESSGSSSSKGNKEPATSTQLQSNTQDLSLGKNSFISCMILK